MGSTDDDDGLHTVAKSVDSEQQASTVVPFCVPPDPDGLFDRLAAVLSSEDLATIARADYGIDFDAHLAALHFLIREHTFEPLGWEPKEVLELIRWDEPSNALQDERRHWRRAFACAALLRANGDAENRSHLFGPNQTLAILIDSLRALGAIASNGRPAFLSDLEAAAAGLLAWQLPQLDVAEDEAAFFGLGLLWFALELEVVDADLVRLCDWIMMAEATSYLTGRRWLLSSTTFDQRHHLWKAIGTWLPERLKPRHGAAVRENVLLIAAALS